MRVISTYPILNHGNAAILFSLIFLYIAAAGSGPWSLDAVFFIGKQRVAGEPAE